MDTVCKREREYFIAFQGLHRMVAILLYVTAHKYTTSQTPHSGDGNNMFTGGECYNTPSKILVDNRLNIQQELSSLYQWQVFTLWSCFYFFLKSTCHTLESIISLALKWLSKYLLTSLQSIALTGHTKDLNLSTLHSSTNLTFLLVVLSNRTERSARPTMQSVRQWHSLSTGLMTCPSGPCSGGQYLQYRWSRGICGRQ